jgi:hypothetical protein
MLKITNLKEKIKNKIVQLIGAICGIKKYPILDNFSLTY